MKNTVLATAVMALLLTSTGMARASDAGPGPGYYKIDLVHDKLGDEARVRMTDQDGTVTWEGVDSTGRTVRREFPTSHVEHKCVTARFPWRAALADICSSGLCGSASPALTQLGPAQWLFTVPIDEGNRSSPSQIGQMQQGMEQMLGQTGPGSAERAELAALWAAAQAEMPSAAQIQQEQLKLAESMEAEARTLPPQEAQELRELARQLRSGQPGVGQQAGGQGSAVKLRWTRVADRCPA